jgi:hypothetical protein
VPRSGSRDGRPIALNGAAVRQKGLTVVRRLASRFVLGWALTVACLVAITAPALASGSVFAGSATGTVITLSGNSFTIQTAGRQIGVVNAMTAAANRITARDYPYVYGGGHAEAGIASIGIKGPGYNGRRKGFDCSGSVAAVLAAGGLWPAGGGVPSDAGIISTLRSEGVIARGVGTGPVAVTLYDQRGVHIFMNIDGRFFGTSDGAGGGNPRGGAGWLDDGAPDASSRAYKPYHFLPSLLRGSTSSGRMLSFQLGQLQSDLGSLQLGETVQVGYVETSSGALDASSIAFPDAAIASGTVGAIAPDGSSFTIQMTTGTTLTLGTGNDSALAAELQPRDTVQVTYTSASAGPTALSVEVTGTPTPANES